MAPKITFMPNGPLQLQAGSTILFNQSGPVEVEDTAYLCRCGLSKNKPYCDGAHREAGFSDSVEISEEVLQEYPGKEVTIHFNRSICSGAAQCVGGLPSVFKSGDGSHWIYPDNDTAENIAAVIGKCPSGALSYSVKGTLVTDTREVAKITIVKDGPYEVEAVEVAEQPSPTGCSDSKFALCRCGLSKNKPFCDYSHGEEGWKE